MPKEFEEIFLFWGGWQVVSGLWGGECIHHAETFKVTKSFLISWMGEKLC